MQPARLGFLSLQGAICASALLAHQLSNAQPIVPFSQDPALAPALPPGVSHDGNRWVEVEVVVFRAEANRSNEIANPGKLALSYFPNARPLWLPLDSYAYPFESEQMPEPELLGAPAVGGTRALDEVLAQGEVEVPPTPEPGFDFTVPAQPAIKSSFKVLDLARDAYVKLDGASARLNAATRNIEQSSDYAVLWHETWRQPLLDRGQVSAIVLQGGEIVGEHTALEGSMRLTRAGDRAHLDLNLWLNEFGITPSPDATLWQVPVVPEAARAKQELTSAEPQIVLDGLTPLSAPLAIPEREIIRIWNLQASEDMNAGALYYHDHPVLGVLIELRPYQLPEAIAPALSEDF